MHRRAPIFQGILISIVIVTITGLRQLRAPAVLAVPAISYNATQKFHRASEAERSSNERSLGKKHTTEASVATQPIAHNVELIGYYDTPDTSRGVHVVGDYAYIAAQAGGLRIVDVSDPSQPREVGFSDAPDSARSVFVSGDYAYVADEFAGLHVINVSNPASPYQTGVYNTPGRAFDVFVKGRYAYVADGAYGIIAVNVTNPQFPKEVAHGDTPGFAMGVEASGNYIFVADSTGGLRILNPNLHEHGSLETPDLARGIDVVEDYVYIADANSGLQVADASQRSFPREIGSFNTPGFASKVSVTGSYAYIADSSSGLRVINIASPASPYEVGFYETPKPVYDVFVSGDNAYVVGQDGLHIVRYTGQDTPMATPTHPSTVTATPTVTPMPTMTRTAPPTATETMVALTSTPTPKPTGEPDLSQSTKEVDRTTARPGEQLQYTVFLTNVGETISTACRMTDYVPATVTFLDTTLSSTDGAAWWEPSSQQVIWEGTLAPNQTITVTFAVRVPSYLPSGTRIRNVAAIFDGVHAPFDRSAETVIGSSKVLIPLVARNHVGAGPNCLPPGAMNLEPNDTFAQAAGPLCVTEAYRDTLSDQDVNDLYYLYATGDFAIQLTDIGLGEDYDLAVYDESLQRVISSENPGNQDEYLEVRGHSAGRYYVQVFRFQGSTGAPPYTLSWHRLD